VALLVTVSVACHLSASRYNIHALARDRPFCLGMQAYEHNYFNEQFSQLSK